jgi:HAUS augmin-like complex subunit 4
MVKGGGVQNPGLAADVSQVIDQLERHCLAPDGSLVSKSAFSDLQLVSAIYYYHHRYHFYFCV